MFAATRGRQSINLITVMATAGLVVGCAHTPKPQAPTADLASAHALVAQAEQSGAQEYDRTDLVAAQQEVQEADNAAASRPVTAARLAREASVDAQLAIARSRATQAQNEAHKVNENLDVLRSAAEGHPVAPPPSSPATPATGGSQQ